MAAVAQWLRCCATNRKVAGSIPAGVIKSFRLHYGLGVDSASNRNEYQEYFLRGKGGRCVRLTTLPLFCAVVMKSGKLKFLEPSGPLQACNGTDLTLPLLFLNFLLNILTNFVSIFSWFLVYCPSRFWVLTLNFLVTSSLFLPDIFLAHSSTFRC